MSPNRILATAIAVLLVSAPLAAQRVPQNAGVPNVVPVSATAPTPVATPGVALERAPSLAPTRANATVGVRAVERERAPAAAPAPLPFREENSRDVAMMIVGGAGLLVGAIVGGKSGTVIMIAGGALGLFGLWQYLK